MKPIKIFLFELNFLALSESFCFRWLLCSTDTQQLFSTEEKPLNLYLIMVAPFGKLVFAQTFFNVEGRD